MAVTARTKLIFLAGDPIGHTQGYAEHAAAIAAAGHDCAYLPAHVPAGRLEEFLAGLRHLRNLAGVVCTIPHKGDAARIARCEEGARRAGSANLLRPDGQGGWEGACGDGPAFAAAARQAGIPLAGRSVQVLGSGGAGRAVAMAIAAECPGRIAVYDPETARAEALAAALAREFPGLAVEAGLSASEVLVNCSPCGMAGDERMPCDASLVPGFVYDIVNRPDTPLLRIARSRGAVADHGRSMMLAQVQAIVAFMLGPTRDGDAA